jgi:hypothetical protein
MIRRIMEEIKQEEGAEEDYQGEVKTREHAHRVHEVVHEEGPAFERNYSEDRKNANTHVIKVEEAVTD